MTAKTSDRHTASFRDPSGFVFTRDGKLYRQVNQLYQDDYDLLQASGLYARLVDKQMLVPHKDVDHKLAENDLAYKVIEPTLIPFISYPYEWCFSQLKDAAVLTLSVLLEALDAGMTLKDASCYNVQFYKGKPILIDTLSFEVYREGEPWIGYRQFCQHFLAPLALMVHKDVRLAKLFAVNIDGIPLDLASSLLPAQTWLDYRLLTHIHMHSRWQTQVNGQSKDAKQNKLPLVSLKALIEDLKTAVSNLKLSSLWPFIDSQLHLLRNEACNHWLATFDKAASLEYNASPKFVFLHFILPHPPYLFSADGQQIESGPSVMRLEEFANRHAYVEQVKFTEKKIEQLVDKILASSKRKPVIILQADHGPASLDFREDIDNPQPAFLKERMRIFNAYYFPDGNYNQLYKSISPVNSFRAVFNKYFATGLELLPDKNYFSDYLTPYKFDDVTTVVTSVDIKANQRPGLILHTSHKQGSPTRAD